MQFYAVALVLWGMVACAGAVAEFAGVIGDGDRDSVVTGVALIARSVGLAVGFLWFHRAQLFRSGHERLDE
jgi:hypothetical protein